MKVIVTGASQGIGRGIVTVLAEKGCAVGMLARSEAPMRELQERLGTPECPMPFAPCDLRVPDAVAEAMARLTEELGGLDALINNAGLVIRKDIFELSLEEWHALVDTNVNGLYYATRAVLGPMRAQGSGHIINLSSISGKVPLPGGSAYAATKFACTGFSQSLFQEVRDFGIKVTTIFPGSVDSQSHRHDPEAAHEWKVTPEEVGQACWDVLNTRPGNCVSEVEIRPVSRPPRP